MPGTRHPRGPAPIAGDGSPLESLALVAVASLVGAGVVFLGSAHVAAWLHSGPPLEAGLTDAVWAMFDVPSHLSDPASSWAPAQRPALPGPFLYYLSLSATLFIGVGLVAGGFRLWRWAGNDGDPLGVKQHVGLARPRDLRRLRVRRATAGRLTMGTVDSALVAAEPQASLTVVGPTGCGKTAGFAIPAMLEWEGPVISTSVKTDLLGATLDRRRDMGTVWIYDPTGCTGSEASHWSPLAACGTWVGAMRVAAWLCDAVQARVDSVTDADYWYMQARKTLAPHLYAGAVGGFTIRDVVRWVDAQAQEPVRTVLREHAGIPESVAQRLRTAAAEERRRVLEPSTRAEIVEAARQVFRADPGRRGALAEEPVAKWPREMVDQLEARVLLEVERKVREAIEAELTEEARNSGELDALVAVESLWGREDRLKGSVYATLQNALFGFADPHVGASAARCDIDFDLWLAGPNTIYVVAAPDEQNRLRSVLSVLVQQAIRRAYEVANLNRGCLPSPCLVLLDEAGNIAPLRDLPAYASTSRSHGISLVTVWQDLAQIRAIYGDRAQTVLNNHRARIFGTGIADPETLDYVSRLVGDRELVERNYSADLSGGGRRSVSEHTTFRRVLPMDAVRRIMPGEGLMLYGSELPAHLRLRAWDRTPELRRLAETPQGTGP